MKKFIAAGFAIGLLASGSAMAAYSIEEMQKLTSLALEDFTRENGDHAQHLTGWKTWKSGEGVKVKIYVAHDGMNMEFNYDCVKHGSDHLQCDAQ